MKIAGAPLGNGPIRGCGSRNPVPVVVAMISTRISPIVSSIPISLVQLVDGRSSAACSTHPIAAVDIEGLSDDIVGFGGREENCWSTVVLWDTHAARGDCLSNDALLFTDRTPFVLGEERVDLIPHWGIDNAWRDRVDVDATLNEFKAERLGNPDHRGLRRAINGYIRLASSTGLRGHVDDLAATALLLHLGRHRLRYKNQTAD